MTDHQHRWRNILPLVACLTLGVAVVAHSPLAASETRHGVTTASGPIDPGLLHGQAVEATGPPPDQTSVPHDNHDRIPIPVSASGWSRLFEYYNVTAKCEPLKFSLTIQMTPRHGTARILDTDFAFKDDAIASFKRGSNGKVDARGSCRLTTFPARLVVYNPDPGYSGDDELVLLIRDGKYVSHEDLPLHVTGS